MLIVSQRLKDLFPGCPAERIDSGTDIAGILEIIASRRDDGRQPEHHDQGSRQGSSPVHVTPPFPIPTPRPENPGFTGSSTIFRRPPVACRRR